MTLAERLAELNPPAKAPRVLVFDIETSPHLAWTFSTWQTTISPDMIVKPSRVLMVGAKWVGERKVTMLTELHDGRDAMLSGIRDMLDEADAAVTYNGPGFDEKHLAREFLLAGLQQPSPWQSIDLLRIVRSTYKFPSNRLGQIGMSLGIGAKMETGGWALWQAVLDGDARAWDKMRAYCRQDVVLTERLLFHLGPAVRQLPHMGLWSGDMSTCYACGSADLTPTGWVHTRAAIYPKVRCEGCGAWSRVMRNGQTRAV